MKSPSADLTKTLAQTKLVVLPEDYFVIHLPVDAKPIPGEWYRPATTRFAVFIREPRQITLIIPRRKWLRMHSIFKKYSVSGPIKVIAFEGKLTSMVSVFMAAIGALLAVPDITVVPVSTFTSNHVLVKKEDLPRTVRLLRYFLQSCRHPQGQRSGRMD
jgi:hypothetical protein